MYEVDKYTVSLLHFDDGIKDETGKVWTANGGAGVSADNFKFGSSSLYLNGNQYLTTPANEDFDFGNEDFTIDWWEYRTTNTKGEVFCRNTNTTNSAALSTPIVAGYNKSGTINYYISSSLSSWTGLFGISMGSAILKVWTHYALVREGATFYAFQNGILKSTTASSIVIPSSPANPSIGCFITSNGLSEQFFNGYIDQFRISKGIARWTSDFNPERIVTAPTNLSATAGDSQVTLSWTAVDGATSYIVKRSTTSGGTYETIASGVTDTSYTDTSVTNGTTYYYIVVTVKGDFVSSNSNEASATPVATDSKALLRVTMIDSSEREYRLSATEADGFVSWFNNHVSTDTTSYAINDSVDRSKEYLSFEKIISFKVIPTVE